MRQTQLIEGALRPRPNDHDDAIVEAAIESLLPRVMKFLGDGDDDGVREDLRLALDSGEMDGYQLTRELERRGWEGSEELVDIMGSAWHERHAAHRAAVAKWVEEFAIKPKCAIGHVTTYSDFKHKNIPAVITRIDEKQATYIVTCESLGQSPGSGFVVPFEQIEGDD